jgi:predicted ATPase/DNA-binding CsgD family transcriptional regulator
VGFAGAERRIVIAAQSRREAHLMGDASSASRRRRASGLPAEVSSFVGRRHEAAEVRRLLSSSRLVTLTGVGGVGKSRLAARVAVGLRRAFADGVRLVDLSPLRDPALLPQTVAGSLPIGDRSCRPTMDVLVDHLRDKQTLVVLDNCEHLLYACAVLAETLLRSAPALRILATSRQPLGVASEQTLAIPPLPLPDTAPRPACVPSAYTDAMRLFAERAEAVLPGFTVTPDNRDTVERICRRLDGIPLAIELAAVRLRALSAEQLLERLNDRFRLLTAGPRTVPPRHRSLRALIDSSHALCTDLERLLWARVSIFSGGLDLEAAEAVCAGDGIVREEIIDLVIGLVDKSILIREEHLSGVRYRLLETIGQYGRERLVASGQEAVLRRRHRDYYQWLSAEACVGLAGPSQVAWLTRLRLEHPNLHTALERCFAEPADLMRGLAMATDLLYHWVTGPYLDEGRDWLGRGLAGGTEPSETRARALCAAGWLALIRCEPDAATAMLEESRSIAERLRLEPVLAWVALHYGMVAMARGHTASAVALCEDAVTRHRANGNPAGLALALIRLSLAYSSLDDAPRAVRLAEAALAVCDAHHQGWSKAYAMMALGIELWREGDARHAAALEQESLRFNRALGDPLGAGLNLEVLAWIAGSEKQYPRAAQLLGILRTGRETAGAPLCGDRNLAGYHAECESGTREALGETAFAAAAAEGAALPLEDALAYALDESRPRPERVDGAPALTRREAEAARLVARGMTNKEIAFSLVIAERTVEGHITHVLDKLGFNSRTQIATWVTEQDDERDPGGEQAR